MNLLIDENKEVVENNNKNLLIGRKVQITELAEAVHLNGLTGEITGYDASRERYLVYFVAYQKLTSVKRNNFELL